MANTRRKNLRTIRINQKSRTTDKEGARNAHSRLNRVRSAEYREEIINGYYR